MEVASGLVRKNVIVLQGLRLSRRYEGYGRLGSDAV
jgi:hypothetical protein